MQQKKLLDYNLIVTGGPTREWIDPIRFLTNASSGKMGAACALAGKNIFQNIKFIHGSINSEITDKLKINDIECLKIESTIDMMNKVLNSITTKTVLIMAAAPADYKPEKFSENKIKKNDENFYLKLIRNPDILKEVGMYIKKNNIEDVYLCGFAAETENVFEYGTDKLKKKGLDMICINDVSIANSGFQSDENIVTIVKKNGDNININKKAKHEIGKEIINIICDDLECCL